MAKKRILFLASGRLAAYEWDGRRPGEPEVFAADEDGLAGFALYLERGPFVHTFLLADLVEEEFREDSIPHVFGADRSSLVRTKLNRLFRDATYAHAVFQGREPGGRRDDRVLFTALIRPDLLAPWVGQIVKHKVPLVGVYSLPLISGSLLKPLGVGSSHALLVTLQGTEALRQTYFLNGNLKLSRLAFIPKVDRDRRASVILAEVEKLRRYLSSLRVLPQDSPLDVHIIGEDGLLKEIAALSPDSVTARHHLHGLGDVARAIGIKGKLETVHADPIFVHLLAREGPPNQFAPESQTRYHRLYRARSGIVAASVVLLGASLFWGGVKFVEGLVAVRETESVARQIRFYEQRYEVARARLPPTPVDTRQMKVAVEAADTLYEFRTSPVKMLAAISDALGGFPSIQLDNITWKVSIDPSDQVGSAKPGEGAGGAGRLAEGAVATSLYQLAHLKARVDPFTGDYRQALDLVSRFADVLRRLRGVLDVQVTSLPLDVGSESRLSGDVTTGREGVRTAAFELRIVLEDKSRELAEIDWGVMRGGVILLVVAVLVSSGILAGGYHFWGKMDSAYQRQRTALLNVRGRYQTIDEEEQIIEAFLPRYRSLESEGIIGREHRLNWIETLRTAATRIRLPSLRYSIASQEPGRPAYLPDTGGFKIYGTDMTLDLGLLHEGDLFNVVRELDRAAVGVYTITACEFRRARESLSQDPKQANVFVTCKLRWHTMQPPEGAAPAA